MVRFPTGVLTPDHFFHPLAATTAHSTQVSIYPTTLMQRGDPIATADHSDFLCPDLTTDWQIDDRTSNIGQVILQAKVGNRRYQFEAIEGYALTYFTGQHTASQVLRRCRSHFSAFIPSDFPAQLLQKLIDLGILSSATIPAENAHSTAPKAELPKPNPATTPENLTSETPRPKSGIQLKSTIEWIPNSDGSWILYNSEDSTYFQVHEYDQSLLSQLGTKPLPELSEDYDITLEQLQELLKNLATAGMLTGTKAQKPPNKFNLLKLLSFQIPLFNPDPWLTQHIDKIYWIWSWQFGFGLCAFISASLSVWLAFGEDLTKSSQQVWTTGGNTTLLTFALLMMLVVSLHELGHAFTLKHYGGAVKEMGLLFICFFPGGYTDTTDQYRLSSSKKRALVVGAGVLVQLVIWAVAVWVWIFSKSYPALNNASYLLMTAALLTVAFNLNPLNKFDGYYLLVALTGINHLRERSFQFYADLLQREESWEDPAQYWILAAYAPVSLAYMVWIFSYLMILVWSWVGQHLPTLLNFTKSWGGGGF